MWWQEVGRRLASAYVGYENQAERLAGLVRDRFLDSARWRLFDDTRSALEYLADRGWSHVIVSNTSPNSTTSSRRSGVAEYFGHVVTSARVGYDKPRPAIFEHALELAGYRERAWMIGDHPVADVAGAEAAGIPAVLVRRQADVDRRADDLLAAAEIVMSSRTAI